MFKYILGGRNDAILMINIIEVNEESNCSIQLAKIFCQKWMRLSQVGWKIERNIITIKVGRWKRSRGGCRASLGTFCKTLDEEKKSASTTNTNELVFHAIWLNPPPTIKNTLVRFLGLECQALGGGAAIKMSWLGGQLEGLSRSLDAVRLWGGFTSS